MDMASRVPDWLTPVSWTFIALALASAAAIAVDVYARGRRHRTVADEVVWVTSALYLGPFALPLYARHGRAPRDHDPAGPPAAVAGLPGGAASALAHLVGVPLVLVSGLTIAGIDLWVMILVIGALAMALLFVHERAATRRRVPVRTAAAVAVLTVLAFDVGMGGWMVLLHLAELMPPATEGAFWFLMQVGIVLGLLTAYPVVTRLGRARRTAVPA